MKNRNLFRSTIRTPDSALGCTLRVDGRFVFETAAACAYDSETAAYAACRFIRHCPQLRDILVREAVRLGLSSGKSGRGRPLRVRTSARSLELPGSRALLKLTVLQGEIVIKALSVDTPAALAAPRKGKKGAFS